MNNDNSYDNGKRNHGTVAGRRQQVDNATTANPPTTTTACLGCLKKCLPASVVRCCCGSRSKHPTAAADYSGNVIEENVCPTVDGACFCPGGQFCGKCLNQRQLGCQPAPCSERKTVERPQRYGGYCGTTEPASDGRSRKCAATEPHVDQPNYNGRRPFDCCDKTGSHDQGAAADAHYSSLETWPINSCFACDEAGCGIKADECADQRNSMCCTPMSQYMKYHGEMARQILCDDSYRPMEISGAPPCNICEQIMPPCRGYYKAHETPLTLDPRTGRPQSKTDLYWKPCQKVTHMSEYRRYMAVPNNGLIKRLKRKLQAGVV